MSAETDTAGIFEAAKAIRKLAEAGSLSAADAGRVVAKAMQQFHLADAQVSHVSDLLAIDGGKEE